MGVDQLLGLVKPEILILIPVLIIIGATIKKTNIIRPWAIPISLGIIGIVVSILILGFESGFSPPVILDGVLQGILSAGMAVYAHQLTIQTTVKRLQDY